MKNIFAYILLAFLSITSAFGQDSQFSQYDASPVLLNPALTGTEKDNPIRSIVQYREQWKSVSSSYVTTAFAIDIPLQRWGIGAYISNNETSRLLSENNFVLSGSYDVLDPKQKKHSLSAGANLGFINKRIDPSKLIFDSQFDERVFNENIESGETLLQYSRFLPELSFGVNYKFIDPKKQFHPYLGAALFHLTRPDESFISNENLRMPMRYVFNGGARLYLNDDKVIINPKATYIGQGKASNIMLGVTGEATVSEDVRLNAGISYRIKDALIPQLGIHYLNFGYILSYDINISTLSEFSSNRGALEFALIYNGSYSGAKRKTQFRNHNGMKVKYR